ncbi:MAG TPA: periplasmic heavy metal sensor [Candidatus Acidoferrum sp.]|nr:periplasmic heavy metal sensor [Candidatus Acidoferrum sp.]
MKTRYFSAAKCFTLVTAGALLVSSASAQDNPPDGARRERPPGAAAGPRGPAGAGGARGGGLNLDDKQRELIREARVKTTEEQRGFEEKLRIAQRDFVRATLAEKYDEKAVREKADAVAKIQADISVLNAKAFSSIAPTLKPEQRESFETSAFGYMAITGGGGRGMGGAGGAALGGRGNPPGDPNAPGGRRRGGAGGAGGAGQ